MNFAAHNKEAWQMLQLRKGTYDELFDAG